MQINVLGPMEVRLDGREVCLVGQRQKALLAALILDHDRVVSVDHLVDVLWDSNPPASARVKVQGHVSAVRRAIGQRIADGPLRTRPPGYVLSRSGVESDLAEFTRLVIHGDVAANSGQPAQAAELLGAALGLWRGQAFADVRSMAVRAAAVVIEERRLLAVEAKADANLAVGRCEVVAAELPECVAAHPHRERLRGLLMRALCGIGCRAEALALYRTGRQIMVSQLGIEPGPQLRGLHQRILAEDQRRLFPAATAADRQDFRHHRIISLGVTRPVPLSGHGRRRRRIRIAGCRPGPPPATPPAAARPHRPAPCGSACPSPQPATRKTTRQPSHLPGTVTANVPVAYGQS